jgi:hypothetical protein
MTADPGAGESFENVLERLRTTLRENDENLAEIIHLSDVSFRLWLDKTARGLAEALGVTLAQIQAFLSDVRAIALNARDSFTRAYRENLESARKVRRIGTE